MIPTPHTALEESAREFCRGAEGREQPDEAALVAYRSSVERLARRPPVSVVIPIFNASLALRACLRSLSLHSTGAEVVLVDDRSTDPLVGEAIESFLDQWPAAKLVVNERNLGFVGSANAGFRAADPERDVVLLNSDTEVTAGWLGKLATAAYFHDDVGTVVPLSNAAGVFSIPVEYEDGDLPAGWTPEMCNRLLEEVAPRLYEEVPVTSGFCLFIRREALDAVGPFDERLFHRGYGEDNDFSERATAAGFRHLVDDATFIAHERGASFGSRRAALKRQNSDVLKALYPRHVEDTKAWLERSLLGGVRKRYARTLRALGGASPEELRSALGPVTTRLAVASPGGDETPGAWQGEERVLVARTRRSSIELDVFGVASCTLRVKPKLRAGLLAWLINRWSVAELTVHGRVLRKEEERSLRAAYELSNSSTVSLNPSSNPTLGR